MAPHHTKVQNENTTPPFVTTSAQRSQESGVRWDGLPLPHQPGGGCQLMLANSAFPRPLSLLVRVSSLTGVCLGAWTRLGPRGIRRLL